MVKPKRTFKTIKDLDGFFNPSEVYRVIEAADNNTLRMLFLTLFRTGKRVSEVLLLKGSNLSQVDEDLIRFTILKKRGGPVDKLKAVDNDFIDALLKYCIEKKIDKNDFIFQQWNKKGYPLTRFQADYYFKKACRKVGIERIGQKKPHCHHLRHSFAVLMSRNLKTLSDFILLKNVMDHSDTKVTEEYLQFAQTEVSDLLNRAFKK